MCGFVGDVQPERHTRRGLLHQYVEQFPICLLDGQHLLEALALGGRVSGVLLGLLALEASIR